MELRCTGPTDSCWSDRFRTEALPGEPLRVAFGAGL